MEPETAHKTVERLNEEARLDNAVEEGLRSYAIAWVRKIRASRRLQRSKRDLAHAADVEAANLAMLRATQDLKAQIATALVHARQCSRQPKPTRSE